MEWRDEELSVGVKKFDNQHERLVELINELHEAMKSGRAKEKLEDILEELHDYTETHFEIEEEEMEEYGYEGLEEQRREHEEFVRQIEEYQEEFANGSITLTMDIMKFLRDWLQEHIKGTDMQYREFFREKGL